ncbi:unnamed protein product [Linum tenue]|uniref:Uncharacterized protein n=1 Tax=Linum tenue TaxID=586396 RepID=A0AAV0GY17_9ROSI|nr:unnamed protein product [Linum tenue]
MSTEFVRQASCRTYLIHIDVPRLFCSKGLTSWEFRIWSDQEVIASQAR